MGISADLILFGKGDNTLEDLNYISLYEFLPQPLHQYIKESLVDIYDLEYYQNLYEASDLIITCDWGEKIELSRKSDWDYKIIVNDPKIKTVTVNSIPYKNLYYLGSYSSGVFKESVYAEYNKKQNYPYLWSFNEFEIIIEKLPEECQSIMNGYAQELLYINLNY